MTRLGYTLIALTVSFVPAGSADAATVTMDRTEERDEGQTYVSGHVKVDALPGETNTLTVEYVPPPQSSDPPAVVVTDTTAPLTAQDRCQQVDSHTVRCQAADVPSLSDVVASLGDMDDKGAQASGSNMYVALHGGAGDDELSSNGRLQGGEGNDTLLGGPNTDDLDGGDGDDLLEGYAGTDYLDGGPGDDTMRGGDDGDYLYAGGSSGQPGAAGRDRLEGGAGDDILSDEDGNGTTPDIGPDVLDGGEGNDSLYSYILRAGPVSVDLSTTTASQGEAGENDTLAGFETVIGGAADDVLIGNDAANYIEGAAGQDVMRGAGGDDRLVSIPIESRRNAAARRYGPDRVYGDAGDDLIETLTTMESKTACGEGEDVVRLDGYASDNDPSYSSLGPLVSQTCERLRMAVTRKRGVIIDPSPVKVARKRLVFSFFYVKCCKHFMEIEQVKGERTELAHKRVRRDRIALNVGRRVIERSHDRTVTLRGKVTKVSINRFVWRFQFGPDPF